jgi:tagatose 6-phosphate kinase
MLVILSLNTAVDRTLSVPGFSIGQIHRADRVEVAAGGKGLNVARVVRQLGEPVRVVGFLGGVASAFIHEQCAIMGIEQRWIDIVGETRTCVIAVDPRSGVQTVLNEPGPTVTPAEVEGVREEIEYYSLAGDTLCISGSAPPGVPDGFYARIVEEARERGVTVLADVSGADLRSVAEERPWALTPNEDEYRGAFGDDGDPQDMARRLAARCDHAVLTLGHRGVLHASGDAAEWLRLPAVHTVNAVGSGDAFVAGFLTGSARGMSPPDAVRLGMACGAANASRFEGGIGAQDDLSELMTRIERVSDDSLPS